MQIPKRPFADKKAQQEVENRRRMEEYFDMLQDSLVEVVESKLLTKSEQPTYQVKQVGFQTFIHIFSNRQ